MTYVEDTATNYLTKLPVSKYRNLEDIISSYNAGNRNSALDKLEGLPEITLSHWKELIHSKRSELF